MPKLIGSRPGAPGTASLVATGCGTAIASVCIAGLFQIEQLAGGIWSLAAVLAAGACCLALARAFARMNDVLTSGAGVLAYLSRALGRSWAIGISAPYVLLTLVLAGVEATIVGVLLSRLFPVPVAVGALGFLVGTWWLCRSGIRIGYRTQAVATWLLVGGLSLLCIAAIAGAALRGELHARLFSPVPSAGQFLAASGQAFFLFMGFEFIVSHAEVAANRAAIRQGLNRSVWILAVFYGLASIGFSCLTSTINAVELRAIPQLAIATQEGGPKAVVIVAVLSLLASFTSLNGALLTLSRFVQALASQGVLPKGLARVDPQTLVAGRALDALLAVAIVATAAVTYGGGLEAPILAGAVSACVVYAAAVWARQQPPFLEAGRHRLWRAAGACLSGLLIIVAVGIFTGSGKALRDLSILCGLAYVAAAWIAFKRFTASRVKFAKQEVAHAD